jgi:hypothetical protein
MTVLHDPIFGFYLKAVVGILAVAGAILAALTFIFRKDVRSIWLTYRGWLLMASLFLACMVLGRPALVGLFASLSLLGLKEFCRATGLYRDWLMSSEAGPFLKLPYKNLPVLDLTTPSQEQLREGVAFIQEQAKQGKVYIHCKIGYSRSAAMAAAHLLTCRLGRNPEEAFERLRGVRPSMVIRPEVRLGVMEFQLRQKE